MTIPYLSAAATTSSNDRSHLLKATHTVQWWQTIQESHLIATAIPSVSCITTWGGTGWFICKALDEPYKAHFAPVSYTHLRAHETRSNLVCRLLLEKKKSKKSNPSNRNIRRKSRWKKAERFRKYWRWPNNLQRNPLLYGSLRGGAIPHRGPANYSD